MEGCSGQSSYEHSQKPEEFVITKLNGFPGYVDGCMCYFSESLDDLKANQFIYLHDYITEVISINGVTVKQDFNNQELNSYKVEIEINNTEELYYETVRHEGTITITSKNGFSVTKNFVGNCGC